MATPDPGLRVPAGDDDPAARDRLVHGLAGEGWTVEPHLIDTARRVGYVVRGAA